MQVKVTPNTDKFPYGSKRYDKGDCIEMPRADAKLLKALGKVSDFVDKVAKPEGKSKKSTYKTKDMKAE